MSASNNAAPNVPNVPSQTTLWHAMSCEAVLLQLNSSADKGLKKLEIPERLLKYGQNAMTQAKSRTMLHIIWEQIYNIITFILIAAAVIAAIFEEWIEVGFIIMVVILNVIIGAVQEGKAESATKAISAMVTASALVIRDGRRSNIQASQLVPGDIIFLTSGDRIPADVRFLETSGVQVTEAMLTGESVPIAKNTLPVREDASLGDRLCIGFSGTMLQTGQGKAVVIATGDSAQIGNINKLMSDVKTVKTPLLVQVEGFGFGLSIICIFVAILTFIVAYWARNLPLQESFAAAISVAVALIPEGLPTVVTITLAMGVQYMAKERSIIRQLPAVETLGALTCICSDKTGTLTKNEMTAVAVHASNDNVFRVTGSGYNPDGDLKKGESPLSAEMYASIRQLLLPAALCNDSTLMPLSSIHAQDMLRTQELTLPPIQLNESSAAPIIAPSEQSEKSSTFASNSEPNSTPALTRKNSIFRAMTTSSRIVTWNTTGDPTEAALLALAMKSGLNLRTLNILSQVCPRLATLPFSSENKFMATLHDIIHPITGRVHRIMLVKGAPDVLLPRCATQAAGADPWTSEPVDAPKWKAANEALSCEGLRVLALCWKELEMPEEGANVDHTLSSTAVLEGAPSLQLNCLVAIVDPPRDEVIRAIQSCHQGGITVKMITGDHASTAHTIGNWIGIETDEVITGPQMEKMSDAELLDRVEGCNIYARASPEHKLRIVKALQQHGHVVAMTGDGVNDAPALRQANIGVAMGITGTEVAKEASRMILLDDNFATITAAVLQGRRTYDNLRKLMMFILPTSVAQGISVAVAVFLGEPAPLNPVQILYVNMITAATLGLVLAVEQPEDNVMTRAPRVQGKPLVGKLITWRSLFVGAQMIVAMLLQQYWTLSLGGSRKLATTIAMNTLVISQCLYCLSCRSMSKSALTVRALYTNPWLTSMLLLNAALQCLITYAPGVESVFETEAMNGTEWLRILMFAICIFLSVELEKAVGPKYIRPLVMPTIRRINRLLSCSKQAAAPRPFAVKAVMNADSALSSSSVTVAVPSH